MSRYHVSHEGQQCGPFVLDEILQKVKSAELTLMDFIYDESKSDWVLLMEFPLLATKLKDFKPKAPPPQLKVDPDAKAHQAQLQKAVHASKLQSPKPLSEHLVTEWYVLKGENKFGPFAFTDLLKMLQQQVVFEFDFTWHPGLSTWKRIAELESFSPENIEKLKATLMPEIEEVFFRRRHRRVDYGATVLVHDNNQVWKGQGIEISAGGASVIMEDSNINPGQIIHLHFKPFDGVPPFNATCEVMSKRSVEGVKDKVAPIRYGLKFTYLNEQTQKLLHGLAKVSSAA
jgi:hypothetical protein